VSFRSVDPAALVWETRPHADDEPARHVAELSEVLETAHLRANIWRYEPGAKGQRHVHAEQEEMFLVLSGTLTMYLGEPPERIDVPTGGVVHVAGGTPLQTANHGTDDLVVFASGYPPDGGAALLDSAIA
jgi:quercetin dioxygenase-like cupin family protein